MFIAATAWETHNSARQLANYAAARVFRTRSVLPPYVRAWRQHTAAVLHYRRVVRPRLVPRCGRPWAAWAAARVRRRALVRAHVERKAALAQRAAIAYWRDWQVEHLATRLRLAKIERQVRANKLKFVGRRVARAWQPWAEQVRFFFNRGAPLHRTLTNPPLLLYSPANAANGPRPSSSRTAPPGSPAAPSARGSSGCSGGARSSRRWRGRSWRCACRPSRSSESGAATSPG